MPIDTFALPLALPQYEMQTEGGTFSAAGTAFLLLPTDAMPRRVGVHWDFAGYGTGGVGGCTALWRILRLYPAQLRRVRAHNTRNPGSGIGLTDSFAYTFNHTSKPDDLRSLLPHEMLHSWVNSLDGSMDSAGGLDRSWFGEGLAVHYQRTLPFRAGMISAEDFLKDINETTGRYYTNIKIATPNAAIPEGFWRDTRVRVLPYDRGSLYFEAVGAQIRAKSGGRRSLDDIVRAMLKTRRGGGTMDEALYRSLLKTELGTKGIVDLDAMLGGATVLPPSDAYGPMFRRVTKPLRRYDLGFDMASLQAKPKIVRGLVAGSNAAAAGLRDGDEIMNGFPQDALQGDQQAYVTLDVRRGGQAFQLRYQPRGETVQAYQWVPVNRGALSKSALANGRSRKR